MAWCISKNTQAANKSIQFSCLFFLKSIILLIFFHEGPLEPQNKNGLKLSRGPDFIPQNKKRGKNYGGPAL